MKEIKRTILRVFFGLELVAFTGIYFFGPHGKQRLWQLNQENVTIIAQIDSLKADVHTLEQHIVQWNTHPFYKEKIAREQLQMACKDEKIYLVH
jgi:cell division protein FtsB